MSWVRYVAIDSWPCVRGFYARVWFGRGQRAFPSFPSVLEVIRGVKRRSSNPAAANTPCIEENARAKDRPDDSPSMERRKKPAHVGQAVKSPTNAPNQLSQP